MRVRRPRGGRIRMRRSNPRKLSPNDDMVERVSREIRREMIRQQDEPARLVYNVEDCRPC